MRSRDGDSALLRPVRAVVFFVFLSSCVWAQEYLVSYRYVVKDAVLYNESLQISPAMTPCRGRETREFLLLDATEKSSFKELVMAHFEQFLTYIEKLGLHVEHRGVTYNLQNSSTTVLTLKTTCFKVDFNDNSARISALKE